MTGVGNQFGYARQNQFNVGGDAYFGYMPSGSNSSDEQEGAESPESGLGPAEAATGGGIAVVAVIGVLAYFFMAGDEPFPAQSDPWPAGVKQEAVAAATSSWLNRCQKSESANPANCPQSLAETSGVSNVRWAFYGNPVEAAVIRYNKADSRFDMLGTFVAVADYTVRKEARRMVAPIKYWAKVHWTGNRLEVQEVKEHSALGDPEIVKQDPKQEWAPLSAKLKDTFTKCIRHARFATSSGCPDWRPPSGATKVK